jgi:hypothetical protein
MIARDLLSVELHVESRQWKNLIEESKVARIFKAVASAVCLYLQAVTVREQKSR